MKKILAIGLLLLVVASSAGAVSADKGNKDDCVNVGKWNVAYDYNYKVYFYDSEGKKLYHGNSEEKGCYYDVHVNIPDDAATYRVFMDCHMAGSDGGWSEYIPAHYKSNGQRNTNPGQIYKNTGIFTLKDHSGVTNAYCSYALECDVGRVISGWKKADSESGSFKVY